MSRTIKSTLHGTLALSALVALSSGNLWAGDDCSLVDGILPAECERPNRDVVVQVPAAPNTEFDSGSAELVPEGFLISIDGQPQVGDKRVEDLIRRTDIALSQADIQVKFDGFGVVPRLDLETVETGGFDSGDRVTFQSRTNYPAYLTRGEIRIIDLRARGGPETLAVVPIAPNGSAQVTLPEGEGLVAVHRVYDARGRYDETEMLVLSTRDDRGFDGDVEEGSDATERRRIPVSGGAVTVYGTGVRQGAAVQTLGERIAPDPDGSFVIQRILPAGDRSVEIRINGAGEDIFLERQITIPRSDWFYFATADLTYGIRSGGGKDAAGGDYDRTYSKGRLAFYTKGKTESGWEITGSADTREGDLEDLFRDFDKKDPRHLLLRLDPDSAYPVYGDDSTLEEDAPTSGKFYLKAEKDGNFLMWGNYKARLDGGTYLRNERTHYGALGYYASPDTVTNGEPRVVVTGYAAQPDNLPGRDVFRGTGGSVYFLSRQDLSTGSETVTIEVRDRDTGRVLSRETLSYGRDYDINYLQGIVTLNQPLTGATGSGTVVGSTSGDNDVRLAVQYEYTPTAIDVDGYALGVRAQVWATDRLRFGATRMLEQTDVADQEAVGVDLLYQFSERTFVELEYAETDGPGFGSTFSNDGGLFVDTASSVGGNGRALRFNAEADTREIGLNVDGRIGGYFEDRTAGFSTLDYQTDADERLWGVFAELEPNENLSWRLYYDDYEDDTGKIVREGGAELTLVRSDRVTLDFGIEHVDKVTPGDADDTGKRTDLAARITFSENDDLEWYVFGQGTVDQSGTLKRNDRLGLGAEVSFANDWSVKGEISDGSLGPGGRLLFSRDDDAGNSAYFGYVREPERELSNITLAGRDRGQYVAGGRRKVNDDLSVYNENTYDLFGRHVALTSTYGVDYDHSEFVSYSGSVEVGRVQDPDGDFDRTALSFGLNFENDSGLSGRGRLEWRRDRGVQSGLDKDADALLLSGTLRYELDEERRLLFSLDSAFTESDESSILDGDYVDVSLGYAYRPIDNDKLNLLFKYEYLYDMYGQQIDGTDRQGPRQRSHVLSLDASYDLDRHWTLGGKLGLRLSESSPSDGVAFAKNNAWLTVANARYHVTHKWDLLLEGRALHAEQAGFTEYGLLGAVYRHVGNNLKVGVGYNFSSFSDDLTDLTYDDEGFFLNVVTKF